MTRPALVLALGLAACGNPVGGQADVVAGDGVLCDLSRQLAGPDLSVACLLKPGDDPHQFRLEPSQKAQIAAARLVLINGYGLTPALAKLPGAIAVAEQAVPESVKLSAEEGHDHEHDHEGHDHGDRDPHVWHDPRKAAQMVAVIAEHFGGLRPERKAAFQQRAAALKTRLEELDAWNRAQLATVPSPRPPLATGHRAFASFASAYGLSELPLVDAFSSSETLRPEALQTILGQLRQQNVPQLFSETTPPAKALTRISELSGMPIAPVPVTADGLAPGADPGGNLVATLVGNTCTIVRGWGGRCDQETGAAQAQRWASGP